MRSPGCLQCWNQLELIDLDPPIRILVQTVRPATVHSLDAIHLGTARHARGDTERRVSVCHAHGELGGLAAHITPIGSRVCWPAESASMAWMVPPVGWVMGAWREVRIVPTLDGAGTSCPVMSVAGLSRQYRVMPGGIRWAAGRLYLGGLIRALYRCRALVWAPWPGGTGPSGSFGGRCG